MISAALLILFLAPQEGAEELVRLLSEDSLEVRAAAEEKLLKLGEAARDALVKAAEKAEPALKYQITRVLKALDLRIQLKGWLAPPSRISFQAP